MDILGLDVGSSSVKAAVLRNGRIRGRIVRLAFPTRFEGVRAEVDPPAVLRAVAAAVRQAGPGARAVDAIALSTMSPSWVAMDKAGAAVTPIVTHQDRRSVAVAEELESRLGKDRILSIAGNRPFPGGISSTTWAWFVRNEPALMERVDLAGHLSTYLHRNMTGQRVVDPSHASFMGLYRTVDLGGWSQELCEVVGARPSQLPRVVPADQVAGRVTAEAARRFGLRTGTPMTAGMVDTGAAVVLAGARPGRLVNVSGSTDVLILCTDRPRPHERVLTRALGVGRLWTSVCTIAAAGSSLSWAKDVLFADWSWERFARRLGRLARRPLQSAVRFEPYLAGDRMSIQQRQGAFTGLTLSSTREHLLGAIVEALAAASAARLPLLQQGGAKIGRDVMVSGGVQGGLAKVLYRDWPGRWRFRGEPEATLRGLGRLEIHSPT